MKQEHIINRSKGNKINFDYPVITLGSPYGIGYEIFLRTIGKKKLNNKCPVAIGSKNIILFYKKLLKINVSLKSIDLKYFNELYSIKQDKSDFILLNIDDFTGNINNINDITHSIDGKCAYLSIKTGAELVKSGIFKSIVTLPVSKENINIFDSAFHGHTEFFQKQWNEKNVFMTFISKKINIILLSTHIPLKKVIKELSRKKIELALVIALELKNKLGLKKDICFLGINPHAGENGLIGKEELWIKKIINEFNKQSSVNIIGPVPADTAFTKQNMKKFDLYIANYHDQGLIPFKIFSFDDGVNLSFGMKYIRTSVDHGTGVDLIGKKKASLKSFIKAYELAVRLGTRATSTSSVQVCP